MGPGLFLIGYNIGTGSITTMGMAGARYGMNLLWALVLSGIFTYVLMVGFGRLTLVTGRTALQSFKTGIPGSGRSWRCMCWPLWSWESWSRSPG